VTRAASVPRAGRRRIVRIAVAATLAGLSACSLSPRLVEPVADERPAAVVLAERVAAHNRRVDLLRHTESRGVVELRWTDEKDKDHFEQVDMRLWIDLPARTALRAAKLGHVFFWLGSDESRYWLFNLMDGDDTSLHVGRHDGGAVLGPGAISIRPLILLDLIGLTPLPVDPADPAPRPVEVGEDGRRAWRVVAPRADGSGTTVVFLDEATGLPVRVESRGPDDAIQLTSTLERPLSVNVAGVAKAALPRMQTLINIRDAAGSEVRFAIGAMDTVADPGAWERYFDLDQLRQHLRPDRVEGVADIEIRQNLRADRAGRDAPRPAVP